MACLVSLQQDVDASDGMDSELLTIRSLVAFGLVDDVVGEEACFALAGERRLQVNQPSPGGMSAGGNTSIFRKEWPMLDAGETQETLLEVNNIEVIYNHVILVLKGVSLKVPKGGITALLGGNGAGKSTFMSVKKREAIVNAAPFWNSAPVIPAANDRTIDVVILNPPTHVPSRVRLGVPPKRPVPVSSPCLYPSIVPKLVQSL